MSSRQGIYIDYLSWISLASARRILVMFVISLLIIEMLLRVADPSYERTAISSLHGTRVLLQQAIESNETKLIAVGDSTLLGGGVADNSQTVMGLLDSALEPDIDVLNFALPGGDNVSSVLLLDSIKDAGVENIDRVIIEVLPSKFIVSKKGQSTSKQDSLGTVTELRRFIPFLKPKQFDLDIPDLPFTQQVEVQLQWMLGNLSAIYRHRDILRTRYVGNYPPFWVIGEITPRFVLERLFGEKGQGTNRLAAHADDFPYNPESAPESSGDKFYFTPHIQGDYLEEAIQIAKEISSNPPIILAHPIHYEYAKINEQERQNYLDFLQSIHTYLETVAEETESELIFIPSEDLQSPELWTRSSAHFNAQGHAEIWEMLKPQLCDLYSCR